MKMDKISNDFSFLIDYSHFIICAGTSDMLDEPMIRTSKKVILQWGQNFHQHYHQEISNAAATPLQVP